MKIIEKENKGLTRSYDVVVTAQQLEKEIDKELQKIGKKVKIPGFRPGKIPPVILRQRYGASVTGEVLERTANQAAQEVIEKEKLVPALAPDVQITDYKEGGDLKLSISLEVMPDIPAVEFEKISIERALVDVSDDEVQQSLDVLAKNNRTLKERPKTAKAKNGDVLLIDFKGYLGKEAFDGGEAENYHLELGSGQFIPGFEEQLIGSKAGDETTVEVPFPKDYHKADLAGQKARFEVTVHAVKEPDIPEADNDLAKELGMESLDALKDAIRQQLENDYGSVTRNLMKKALFDELDVYCSFKAPEKMVNLEFDSIWSQYNQAKERGEMEEDRPEDELKKEYRTIAERRVRLGIYLSSIARQNDIQVSQNELGQALQQQARMYPGQEQKIFEFYQQNPQHIQELRGPILEEKAVDHILTKVKLKDKKMTAEELLKYEAELEKPATDKKKEKKKSSSKGKASSAKTAKKTTAKATDKKPAPKKKTAAKKPAAKKASAKTAAKKS